MRCLQHHLHEHRRTTSMPPVRKVVDDPQNQGEKPMTARRYLAFGFLALLLAGGVHALLLGPDPFLKYYAPNLSCSTPVWMGRFSSAIISDVVIYSSVPQVCRHDVPAERSEIICPGGDCSNISIRHSVILPGTKIIIQGRNIGIYGCRFSAGTYHVGGDMYCVGQDIEVP